MIYFQSYDIGFLEVPNETSLCIYLGGCSFKCDGCHSPWLWEREGKGIQAIVETIDKYKDMVSCVCILGGEDWSTLKKLFDYCHSINLKTAWYTGFRLEQIKEMLYHLH